MSIPKRTAGVTKQTATRHKQAHVKPQGKPRMSKAGLTPDSDAFSALTLTKAGVPRKKPGRKPKTANEPLQPVRPVQPVQPAKSKQKHVTFLFEDDAPYPSAPPSSPAPPQNDLSPPSSPPLSPRKPPGTIKPIHHGPCPRPDLTSAHAVTTIRIAFVDGSAPEREIELDVLSNAPLQHALEEYRELSGREWEVLRFECEGRRVWGALSPGQLGWQREKGVVEVVVVPGVEGEGDGGEGGGDVVGGDIAVWDEDMGNGQDGREWECQPWEEEYEAALLDRESEGGVAQAVEGAQYTPASASAAPTPSPTWLADPGFVAAMRQLGLEDSEVRLSTDRNSGRGGKSANKPAQPLRDETEIADLIERETDGKELALWHTKREGVTTFVLVATEGTEKLGMQARVPAREEEGGMPLLGDVRQGSVQQMGQDKDVASSSDGDGDDEDSEDELVMSKERVFVA